MEEASHGAPRLFGGTGAVYSREALAAPWHALHTTSLHVHWAVFTTGARC